MANALVGIERGAEYLDRALRNARGPEVSKALPAAPNATAVDLADGTRPAPLDLAALAEQLVPDREFRVGNIMAIGTVGLLTGHGGAGKTQLGLHLGLCLALGQSFFGEDVRRAKVGFVSAEDDDRDLHYRLVQQTSQLKVSLAAAAGSLFVYDVSRIDVTLLADEGDKVGPTARYWWLKQEVEERGIEVLILDNLMALFGGNINNPVYATKALALLAQLVPEGGNVIVIAHVDKLTAKSGYSTQGYSGTAAWHNRSRWRWLLYAPKSGDDADPDGDDERDDGRRILEVQKNNAGPAGGRISLRLLAGALMLDGVNNSIVASIARSNERGAVLKAMRDAEDREIPVPTNKTSASTAYEALEVMPDFPASLRGKKGKRRLFKILAELRADREIEPYEFKGAGRHRREGFRLRGVA